MLKHARVPVVGLVAYSGTGKTTLGVAVVRELCARGLRVAVIKHAHHAFDIDQPGKDSYRLRQAGAVPVMVASSQRWAMVRETPGQAEANLDELLRHLAQDELDLVLVEGFKHEAYPKIELRRSDLSQPALFPHDPDVVAVVADTPPAGLGALPWLDLNRPAHVADFIVRRWLL